MNPDIRDEICDMGGEDALMFDNPDFDKAVIGLTTDGRVVMYPITTEVRKE